MQRNKSVLLISCLIIGLTVLFCVSACTIAHYHSVSEDVFANYKVEIDSEYKKHSVTELVETVIYENAENAEDRIYYHRLQTTFYEGDPSEVTGLHTEAFETLFPTELMDSCMRMRIQDWDAALYKNNEVAYLCWTVSPEVSYVLEYNPTVVDDSQIINTAESSRPVWTAAEVLPTPPQ